MQMTDERAQATGQRAVRAHRRPHRAPAADGQLRSVCLICPPPTPYLHSASLFVPVLAPLDLLVCYKYWLLSHIPHTLAFHLLIHDDHVTKEPTVAGAFTDAGRVAQRSVADTPQYRTDA